MKDLHILAVVVTYNRLPLLQRTVDSLRRQTLPLQGIVVVDNGSTDGTSPWLDSQEGLTVIHQANVGGAGGFHTGIARAHEQRPDWIWCMDDDVFPRPECLEALMQEAVRPEVGILAPRRLLEGRVYTNDFLAYNLTQPFRSMYRGRLAKMEVTAPTEIAGTAFEGLCLRGEVVDRIGLPNRDLFIFCDDTDYCLRAHLAGYRIWYVPAALMDKEKFFAQDTWAQRQQKKKWKRLYQIRNSAYLNHHYGRNWGVRYVRSLTNVLGYVFTAALTAPFSPAYQFSDTARFWQAFRDGLDERLGKY